MGLLFVIFLNNSTGDIDDLHDTFVIQVTQFYLKILFLCGAAVIAVAPILFKNHFFGIRVHQFFQGELLLIF